MTNQVQLEKGDTVALLRPYRAGYADDMSAINLPEGHQGKVLGVGQFVTVEFPQANTSVKRVLPLHAFELRLVR